MLETSKIQPQPQVWNQETILKNGLGFLAKKPEIIARIGSEFILRTVGFTAYYSTPLDENRFKQLINREVNDISELRDRVREIMKTLDPSSNEFDKLSSIAKVAEEDLLGLSLIETSVSEINQTSFGKHVKFSAIGGMAGFAGAMGLIGYQPWSGLLFGTSVACCMTFLAAMVAYDQSNTDRVNSCRQRVSFLWQGIMKEIEKAKETNGVQKSNA